MKNHSIKSMGLLVLFSAVLAGACNAAAASFYKEPPLFRFTHAQENAPKQFIDRFGPVGMSIELRLPPFQMYVGTLEEGSPAEKAGGLKTGQKIESINGQVLKDIDPRIQLAGIITEAEATDGKIRFLIRETDDARTKEVVVNIPVLGAYSPTWPLNCEKSERIVRDMARWVKTQGDYSLDTKNWTSLNGFGMLFLLSTGDKSDLDHVRGWISEVVEQYKDAKTIELKPWVFGSAAIPLAEYYLRTGDKRILPVIQKICDYAAGTMYNGGWSGRGQLVFGYMGGGHMNAAGIHVATFLYLAKQCGVDVDEVTLQESLKHFYRFAGRGSLAYGDHLPETYFIDNGKNGALAFTMAAAASLMPSGEDSVYAGARDVSAMRGFYGTNYMLTGHTGGGIGEVWRGPAMGFLYEKEPDKYRSFMDGRLWHLELSRRFDGSFGILDGTSRYDQPFTWGQAMALQYTVPRKTLRITGASRTPWSKPYTLPERPWGTAEDDDFCRIEPARGLDGTIPTFDDSLEGGSVSGVERMFRNAEDTKALALKYCLHPDHEMRREIGAGYTKRNELDQQIVAMLRHEDARVRRAALAAIHSTHKGTHTLPPERLTDEMKAVIVAMVNDPDESWWVVQNALRAMSLLPVEETAPHIERLLYWLQHEEWWLQGASMYVLAPLAADERYYEKILPVIGKVIVNNRRASLMADIRGFTMQLNDASPKIQVAGLAMLSKAYSGFPAELNPPAGERAADVMKYSMKKYVLPVSLLEIARRILEVPGGYTALFKVAKERHPEEALPYQAYYLRADPSALSPDVRKAIEPIFLNQIVPEFITRNLRILRREMTAGSRDAKGKLTELADLYRRGGVNDYEWKLFGPERDKMEWHYLIGKHREQKGWNRPDFDPDAAGWKKGFAPFGDENGKLRKEPSGCLGAHCGCGASLNTLWTHDELLLWGKFKYPKAKDGHAYRLLIGGGSHVGMKGNVTAFINGRPSGTTRASVPRGRGGRPRGAILPANLVSVFQGDEVFLSASCTPRQHKQGRVDGNFVAVWFEEMKYPPVNDQLALKGLTMIPMQSSAWQQAQETDEAELYSDDGLFTYDGTFRNNPDLLGTWQILGEISSVADFRPGEETKVPKPRFRSITFEPEGLTDSDMLYWSGDTLMEIGKLDSQALKMKMRTIEGDRYLFVEVGDFTFTEERSVYKQPRTWTSPWFVFAEK